MLQRVRTDCFFQLLISFEFPKSILDDAIVDIKMIFGFWLKT